MKEFFYPTLNERQFKTVLPNGLRVLVQPRKGFSKKIAYFVTDFGSIHTNFTLDGQQMRVPDGVAHYLEHKLFDMPEGDVTEAFSALGAIPNAFTSNDMTAYFFTCTDHFEQCLELLLKFVSTPYFTEESVAKEQGIIAQEIGMNLDNPYYMCYVNLMEMMYRNHPVTVSVLGSEESIARITPQILRDCHRAFYNPSNMLLCVVGDVDPEAVAAMAERVLGNDPVPTVERQRHWDEDMTCKESYRQMNMQVASKGFQMGFKCEPIPKGEDGFRAEVVAALALEALVGESSALYLKLYEEGTIDSSFGASFDTLEDLAMVTLGGDAEDPETIRDAVIEEARRIAREGISPEDLQRLKRSAMGRRLRRLDNFDGMCYQLSVYHLLDYDYLEFPKVYEKITEDELRQFLERVFTYERCAISVVLPLEQGEAYES